MRLRNHLTLRHRVPTTSPCHSGKFDCFCTTDKDRLYSLAQSICTHYSKLSGRPDIFLGSGTLKKLGPKKSRVPKNRFIVIQKENRQTGLFSFGITMTLIFCTLLFLDLIFLKFQTLKKYQVDLIN